MKPQFDLPGVVMTQSVSEIGHFNFDRFLLNQKLFSLNSKYFVYSEDERPLFYVDRPLMKMKTELTVYTDESKATPLLQLRADSMWSVINHTLTLADMNQQVIATFKRQGWYSMLRRTWKIYDAHGREIAQAQEDSLWKALARRVPYVDIVGSLIRTNFNITRPDGAPIGEFIRRYTVGDKYVMDLSGDLSRSLDRRIAVGLAVLLDNLETR